MTIQGMELTEIQVKPMEERHRPVMAYARIVFNGAFAVTSIRIVSGKFGLFISWPREWDRDKGQGWNLAYPIRKDLQEHCSTKILEVYRAQLGTPA